MLSIKDLIVSYADVSYANVSYANGKNAVDCISLCLQKGDNIALIGANGAGKTTLLHAITGVIPIKSGEITVDGLALTKKNLRQIRQSVGLVFQNPDDQLFMPNIYEDLAFGLRSYGANEAEVEKRVNQTLIDLGISHLHDTSPLKLSGGEKRLCAIAAVLAMNPAYMLFDEPTAFLDPKARRRLAMILKGLPQGKLIATHDLPFAKSFCNGVIIIKNGRVMAEGGIALSEDAAVMEEAGL